MNPKDRYLKQARRSLGRASLLIAKLAILVSLADAALGVGATQAADAPVAPTAQEPLDSTLKPEQREGVAETFRDMGVVQKKAMQKSHRILFAPFWSMDFSDGPYTQYSINTNFGYALSDFFELYANVAPVFVSTTRDIVKKVTSLQLANGQYAQIVSSKPKRQYGVELLWAPLYGKDSLGIRHVVRSDTFFKLGIGQIQYEVGNGLRFVLGVGKSYFLSKSSALRFTVNGGHIQQIVDGEKKFRTMALIELGFVFYF